MEGEKKENNDVLEATNVIAGRLAKLRPTGTLTARAYLYANHFWFALSYLFFLVEFKSKSYDRKCFPLTEEQVQEQTALPNKIYLKDVSYRSGIWHINLTNEIKIRGKILFYLSIVNLSRSQIELNHSFL